MTTLEKLAITCQALSRPTLRNRYRFCGMSKASASRPRLSRLSSPRFVRGIEMHPMVMLILWSAVMVRASCWWMV